MEQINFLVADTTTTVLKLAISANNTDIVIDLKNDFQHIENLLQTIDDSLKKNNIKKQTLDFIGVCEGPGSFTGIRIGIASVSAISFALSKKSFGFSVFDVYRFLLKNEKNAVIIPVIDAKKNKYYCSFIEQNEEYEFFDYDVESIKNRLKKISDSGKRIIFCGKDFDLLKKNISIKYDQCFQNDYNSSDILKFAKDFIAKESNFFVPKPIYLRKSEAELNLIAKKQS